ncbi:hypothetical protein OS493_011321 [Desmophyllum pertusum]|uniref:Uncharacterized protein n=1 Tax=Desmophyllum pertusum TaxID=174260 RepID=A0A9W9Z229_9CNID|nr:hypothetical protein OS493_011321 [Desmophyllum pertusum]
MAGIVCHRNHQVRFTKHDGIALCLAILIPLTAILLTMVSVLPSLGASPLPDFANPIEQDGGNKAETICAQSAWNGSKSP